MKLPNIEAERIKHQLSKSEFAELMGVSRRTVQNWQSGTTEMPLSKLLSGNLSETIVNLLVSNFDSINDKRDREARTAGRRYYETLERK